MKQPLFLVFVLSFAFGAHAADSVTSSEHYLLISDDGNLHAQPCTISKKDNQLYLTIDQADFFPQTKSLQLFPKTSEDSDYRAVITPNLISKTAQQDIDTVVFTLKSLKDGGFYGDFSATRKTIDSNHKGKLLLYPVKP